MKFPAYFSPLLMMSLFLPFFAQASYIPTSEGQCTRVDLREEFPLKMRNQNELAWCFAHAASDYLQYTYRIEDQISAADIAINYSKTRWSKFVNFIHNVFNPSEKDQPAQTGLIKIAIKRILPQGYCPESALPSDEWTRIERDGKSSKVEILQASLDLFKLQADVQAHKYANASSLPWRYEFKNIDPTQFYILLQSSTKKTILSRLRDQACAGERKPFPKIPIASKFRLKGRHVFQRFNQSFDQEKMPVTIDFFSDVLRHYDRPKRRIENLHTVLVYARKFNKERNECEYLIKDSYGEGCSKYDPKIECEQGNIWLPESKLYRSLLSDLIIKRL